MTRRAPEATGAFIAAPMSRLNEALLVSFGAMSGENLAAVDRMVGIARELDRYHGLFGGAGGTETRRKLLESLVSGAETPNVAGLGRGEEQAARTEADLTPDWAAFLSSTGRRDRGAPGTESFRNPLESLNSGAATGPPHLPT